MRVDKTRLKVAAIYDGKQIPIWDLTTSKRVQTCTIPESDTAAVSGSLGFDGARLVVPTVFGAVHIFDARKSSTAPHTTAQCGTHIRSVHMGLNTLACGGLNSVMVFDFRAPSIPTATTTAESV
eukprot:gnl/Hemi2/28316_TR9355_c0_g1_i2.p3 gnl/Hemi2/28316_TR9355_c0_g1~~gnl/Hemi2/28316_TR9355_c0_g1_i2.p3  ORF type:complete len:124 (-),score=10.29 gnl/Hemi2/28316_TR9355_c0_g1_i2:267-638(-)